MIGSSLDVSIYFCLLIVFKHLGAFSLRLLFFLCGLLAGPPATQPDSFWHLGGLNPFPENPTPSYHCFYPDHGCTSTYAQNDMCCPGNIYTYWFYLDVLLSCVSLNQWMFCKPYHKYNIFPPVSLFCVQCRLSVWEGLLSFLVRWLESHNIHNCSFFL